MTPRNFILSVAIIFSGCVRRPEPFWTPSENDKSIIFPLSVGGDFVEVKSQEKTYELDGEVLHALMIVSNDLFPPGISNPNLPCWARQEAHTYRFTRREDIIFVYVDEAPEYCGRKVAALDSGAKYAISKDGRILRRVIGSEPDHDIWRLKTPDGGTVTVVTESGVIPDLEDLEKPDSGILKIITEPVDMPGVRIWQRREGGERASGSGAGRGPGRDDAATGFRLQLGVAGRQARSRSPGAPTISRPIEPQPQPGRSIRRMGALLRGRGVQRDKATLPEHLDVFRLRSRNGVIVITERFADTLHRLGFEEFSLRELPVR